MKAVMFNPRIRLIVLVFIAATVFLFLPGLIPQVSAGQEHMDGSTHEPSSKFMFWALLLGGFSAVSLVLGSLLGLVWQPGSRLIAAFTAFGGGALLAALSIELIAPTVISFVQQNQAGPGTEGNDQVIEFTWLLVGCALGGIIFYMLNEALNSSGGYLRKVSTTISYFNRQRRKRYIKLVKRLSKVHVFNSIPPEHLDALISRFRQVKVKPGKYLFYEGNMLQKFYLLESGNAEIIIEGKPVKHITEGEFIGETAMLSREPVKYSVMAASPLNLFELTSHDLQSLRDHCPEFHDILENEARHEFDPGGEEGKFVYVNDSTAGEWKEEAMKHLHYTSGLPTQAEINESEKKQASAPLSIWLGIFLDGIPESFVIGAGFLLILTTKMAAGSVTFSEVVPYTLIAGLFLSNFPEAMSSSIGMKKMGWKPGKILALWTSLMLMTAIGSVFGYYFGSSIPSHVEIGVEGLASGAMLTMIAQTMIPEAVHIGGTRVTGLSTLAGYLAAVGFKVFE